MTQTLTPDGLIYGASAPFAGVNVTARIRSLDALARVQGKAILDVGCGTGSYALALRERCERLVLLDILPSNLREASRRLTEHGYSSRIACSSAEELPVPSETFDVVLFIEVLDHVRDVRAALAEAHRVLRPGGACYLTVPNRLYPLETHPVRIGGRLLHPTYFPFLPWIPPLHRRTATARVFTAGGLQKLARSAGFSNAAIGYMMPPLEYRGTPFRRRLMSWLEDSPARIFGVSLAARLVR